jgi:hypothetical protein
MVQGHRGNRAAAKATYGMVRQKALGFGELEFAFAHFRRPWGPRRRHPILNGKCCSPKGSDWALQNI